MGRKTYRLPPCASYNIECMEGWLNEMAQRGLMLTQFAAGFGVFERCEPRNVRYSLVPAVDAGKFANANGVPPDRSTIAMMRDFGWEYVAKRGAFHIYRALDNTAADMHSDPDVYMVSLKEICWRKLSIVLFLVILWVVNLVFRAGTAYSVLLNGEVRWLLLFVAIIFVSQLIEALYLMWLIRRLKRGDAIAQREPGDLRAAAYNCLRAAAVLMVAAFFVHCILSLAGIGNIEKQTVDPYTDDPPFATLTDLFGSDKDYESVGDNTYRMWSDAMADVNYDWNEHATVMRDDGYILRGWLRVSYHEAKNEKTAILMAKQYFQSIKRDNTGYDEKRPIDVSCLDFDYAEGYTDSLGRECIVVCEGNRVLCVRLRQYGMNPISIEEWSRTAVSYLK